MLKVLSTKLKVEEIDRFAEMAEQQGESKSGLVRRLVLDYLDGGSKAEDFREQQDSERASQG